MEVILKRAWFTPRGRFRPNGSRPVTVPDELRDSLPSDAEVVGEESPAIASSARIDGKPSGPLATSTDEPEADAEPDEGPAELTAADALAKKGEPFMAFKAAAKQVLGDACPQTKDEIVAALEAAASE